MSESFDVVVVGAGPAGTAAAITAVARGLSVVCVDKATFPRDKTCGDGLTAHALRLLERLGVERDVFTRADPAVIAETVLVSPSGRRVALPMPRDGVHAAVVTRRSLDAALVALARDRGVEVRDGHEVTHVAVRGGVVEVNGLRARYAVAADGHWSVVRRLLAHAPPDLGEWHAARQYFEGVDDDRLWVFFTRELLPGYAWVFPLPGGRANVGYGVLRAGGRRGKDLKALWPEVLEQVRPALGSKARSLEPLRAWPIPARYDPARLVHGERILFAGDAAGVADPMTGEGIAQAIETGMLAAASIATGADYVTLVRRALGRDLRCSAALQRVLRHPLGARAALRAVDISEWTRRHFARWMWEDYPRAVLATPARWHRGMLTPPGAWHDAAHG